MNTLKKLIPAKLKLFIRLKQRSRNEKKSGVFAKLARTKIGNTDFSQSNKLSIQQPIFYNPLSANKVVNIKIAVDQIAEYVIHPGEIFSMWHLIGNPTEAKGFKKGRNIIGDSLQEDVGGGLCQVSGMLYHLALQAGLKIVERHCHSLDLYEEDKRFTPLGTDAAVVYGYKDIQFENCLKHPIKFEFDVSETSFTGHLVTASPLTKYELRFEREEFEKYRTVKTFRILDNSNEEYINLSKYLLK
jgi:vancomycin resistance protein VanW